jgi:phenylacetate-CoA ligase
MIVLASLAPALRRELQEAFGAEIFDRYGPHEMEGVAYACHEHRGMHMAVDCVHTEFLDDAGRPVRAWDPGHIVLTDLDSRVMPLIRYRIGDIGRALDGPCTCGRGFPLMAGITCRARDVFQTRDGARLLPDRLVSLLQEHPAVRLFQIVQAADLRIEARIVPDPARWTDATPAELIPLLSGAMGHAADIHVVRTDRVTLEPNGKYCYAKRVH